MKRRGFLKTLLTGSVVMAVLPAIAKIEHKNIDSSRMIGIPMADKQLKKAFRHISENMAPHGKQKLLKKGDIITIGSDPKKYKIT